MDIALQLSLSAIVLGSVYSLFAVSLNLVWGISSVVNVAHGSFLVLGAYMLWQIDRMGLPLILVVPVLLAGAFAVFTLSYRVLFRALGEENIEFGSLLVTWGISLIVIASLRGTIGTDLRKTDLLTGSVRIGTASVSLAGVFTFGLAMTCAAALAMFLKLSDRGREMRAVGSHPELAAAVGINVPATRAMAFALGMTLAISAGMLFGTGYVFFPNVGDHFIIKAVAIVLVAGLGKLWRTWTVGMFLAGAETLTQYLWSVTGSQLLAYAMLVLVLLIRKDEMIRLAQRFGLRPTARRRAIAVSGGQA
jgi:branched-chain amino acid transport system permease protein